MHEPTILVSLSVFADKSSYALDNIAFQKLAAPSVRIEPEFCLILRTRGSRVIALCKRDRVSLAGDGVLLGVFVFRRLSIILYKKKERGTEERWFCHEV